MGSCNQRDSSRVKMIYRIKQIIYDYKFKLQAASRDGDVEAVKKYLASVWDFNQKYTLWGEDTFALRH